MSGSSRTRRSPSADYAVGYAKAPPTTRFKAGQSGNPKGRPEGSRNEPPYETVLGQLVTIREDGDERQVTAAEAFLLHIAKSGLAGDGAAGRSALAAIEEARALRAGAADQRSLHVILRKPSLRHVHIHLEHLPLAVKLDPLRPTARMRLEPWLVQAALARLGERRLTLAEQADVYGATRTPRRVRWPEWWGIE